MDSAERAGPGGPSADRRPERGEARHIIKRMETASYEDPINQSGSHIYELLTHVTAPALPTPHLTAHSPTDIKISTTCSQLSRCRHERVRPRPPQRGARGPAGSRRTGAQQHQVTPRRRLRVQLVLDVLATDLCKEITVKTLALAVSHSQCRRWVLILIWRTSLVQSQALP